MQNRLPIFNLLQANNITTRAYAYASNIHNECLNMESLPHAKLVHAHTIQTAFKPRVSTGTFLLTIYAKCGRLSDAGQVFDKMPERNVVSWTSMIAGHARKGMAEEALMLFYKMQEEGIQPNEFSFATVLPACTHLVSLQLGKQLHQGAIRCGFETDLFVASALVDMYCKCGSMKDARNVFDKMPARNVVSWNALIRGYVQNGYVDEALRLFGEMPERNVISWSTIIAGYAQHGHFNKALEMFREMQLTGLKANAVTLSTLLPACANLACLQQGKEAHEDIIRSGFQCNVFVQSALVDMYAKCGSIEEASKVFNKIPKQDLVSWNAMILGCAMHGYGEDALKLFNQMAQSGTKPDHITFIGVLSACCHAGLVDDGWQYFHSMNQRYQIRPGLEHYCCMVDLLGRAGHLDKAQDFILKMPGKPDATLWASLLGACRVHSNVELAEHISIILFELDPKNASHYVLLSNIYAAAGRWDDKDKMRKVMKERNIKRTPGCSWIEVNNEVHNFIVPDKSHPQSPKFYRVGSIVWVDGEGRACSQH